MASAGTPVVFVHGLWLHADSWGNWVDLFRGSRLRAAGAGLARRRGHGRGDPQQPDRVAGFGIDAVVDHYAGSPARSARGRSSSAIPSAASSSSGCSDRVSPPPRWRSIRRRSRASCICRRRRCGSPGSRCGTRPTASAPSRLPPGSSATASATRSPRRSRASCTSAGRSPRRPSRCSRRRRQLRPGLTGQGRHRQRDPRAAADHGRRQGPHGSGGDQPDDAQAVPQVAGGDRAQGVPGQGALARPRQRLARGRRRRARLARGPLSVAPQPGSLIQPDGSGLRREEHELRRRTEVALEAD